MNTQYKLSSDKQAPPKSQHSRVHELRMRYEEIGPAIGCVYLTGCLDIPYLEQIELQLNDIMAGRRRSLIIEMSGVEMMTSTGLGVLISNANALMAHGKRMILLKPHPRVAKVVRISFLDTLLPIEYDLDTALNRIRVA
jgi:anti-sigma B factor antagonist